MVSNVGSFDPKSALNLIVFDQMLSQISECGHIKKPIKLKSQGSRLRIILSGMKFAA